MRFEACDLADSSWEHLSASRVELLGCRLIGLQATNGRIEDMLIKGCNAVHAQFWSTVFKRVRFESCNLSETNFQSADLAGAIFDKCDLRGAKMADAKLVGADLRSSQLDGARLGIKELQGAIVSIEQAVSIARTLGVDVRLEWHEVGNLKEHRCPDYRAYSSRRSGSSARFAICGLVRPYRRLVQRSLELLFH